MEIVQACFEFFLDIIDLAFNDSGLDPSIYAINLSVALEAIS